MEGLTVTYPEPEPGQEPPTLAEPAIGQQPPAPPVPSQPVYPPGSAAVPQWAPAPDTNAFPTAPYQAAPGYPPPGYPQVDYAGTPYAPAAKSRTGLIVGIVVGVLVLCIAGSIGGGLLIARSMNTAAGDPDPTTGASQGSVPTAGASTPAGKKSATPSSTRSSSPAFTGDLRDLLVPRPSGAKALEDFGDADGKLTLDETAELFVDPTALRKELQSLNFSRGADTHWSKDDDVVLIFLFQFDTAAHAADYVDSQESDGIEGYEANGSISGISGSSVLVDNTPDEDGDRSVILLASKGSIVSYVTVWRPTIDLPGATSIAQQQYKRLP